MGDQVANGIPIGVHVGVRRPSKQTVFIARRRVRAPPYDDSWTEPAEEVCEPLDEVCRSSAGALVLAATRSAAEAEERRRARPAADGSWEADRLIEALKRGKYEIPEALPFLPDHVWERVSGDDFREFCQERFESLDINGNGTLSFNELTPLIVEISQVKAQAVTEGQARAFLGLFDQNSDGIIEKDEFSELVMYVMVSSFLASKEGQMLQRHARSDPRKERRSSKESMASLSFPDNPDDAVEEDECVLASSMMLKLASQG